MPNTPPTCEALWTIFGSGITTVRGIGEELQSRGIRAPRGNTWHSTAVAQLLNRLHNANIRTEGRDDTMLSTTGTLLVFLGVIGVAFEATGPAALFGAVGMWMISRAAWPARECANANGSHPRPWDPNRPQSPRGFQFLGLKPPPLPG